MSIQSVERRRASRGRCAEAVSLFLILMLALSFSVAHAATFTVTNLNDSGPGSLRQAVLDANASLTSTQDSMVSASFTTHSIPFDPTVASTISWFYAAAFSRTPVPNSTLPDYGDLGGLGFWTAAYLSGEGGLAPYLGDVYATADFFVQSPEFQSRYSASLTNEAFVAALYENMLGRAPDEGGLAFWVSQLDAGASRGSVLADFTNTQENRDSNPLRKAAMQSFIAFLAANHGVVTPTQAAAWLAANPDLDAALVDVVLPNQTRLTVTKTGTGSGTVSSNPAGINCGSACAADFAAGAAVTLTANPASGSTFSGWSGACSGAICQLTMDEHRSVTATFVVSTTNQAPQVDAGAAQTIEFPATITLNGVVTDDGLPNPPGTITVAWSQVSGPEEVTFGNAAAASTTATFFRAGTYTLRLTANDGELMGTDDVTIIVDRDEGLSSEVLQRIDALPDSWLPANEIILPGGQSLADYVAEHGITVDHSIPESNARLSMSGVFLGANALPPASTPQQRKDHAIAKMLSSAQDYACTRSDSCDPLGKWNYPQNPEDYPIDPAL